MGTDRYKVQGYLESEVAERFTAWKKERGIEKDSAALNELLKDYFFKPTSGAAAIDPAQIEEIVEARIQGLEQKLEKLVEGATVAYSSHWMENLNSRFEQLDKRLTGVEKMVDVQDGVPTLFQEALESVRLQEYVIQELQGTTLNQLLARIEAVEATVRPIEGLAEISYPLPQDSDESPKPVNLPDNLTQTELAERLNCHKSQVSRRGKQSDFEEWSKERDPDAIAWNYDPKSKRYLVVK